MMRMRTKSTGISPIHGGGGGGGRAEGEPENWELRPCGMLVQKRIDTEQTTKPTPTIRVRVKYRSIYHEIHINSQATFGELKKRVAGATGIHHQDQKVYYKDKERDSKEYLDIVGVKDKSKLVLLEDPISQEKRYLEMRKNAKMEKATKSISDISLQVDSLAAQVTVVESVMLKGGRLGDQKEVVNLIELLMNELIKLDSIVVADGDVKLQRKMQVRRVQKYVETLDMLKMKNEEKKASRGSNVGKPPRIPQQKQRNSIGQSPLKQPREEEGEEEASSRNSTSGTVVVTTQWETFDSASSSSGSPTSNLLNPRLPWDNNVFV